MSLTFGSCQMRARMVGSIAAGLFAGSLILGSSGASARADADLKGEFVGGAHSLAQGERSTFEFRVTNGGPSPAANIDATVHVPSELKFVKTKTGQECTYDTPAYGNRNVHCYLNNHGTLQAGDALRLKVVLKGKNAGIASCSDGDWTSFYPGPNKCLWGFGGDSSPQDPNLNDNHDQYRVRVTD